MSRRFLILIVMSLLLSACGTNSSWDKEDETFVSERIMADNVKVEWKLDQDAAAGHHKTAIRLAIKKTDGTPIEKFDQTHEKLLHLIVVSKDLSYFNHIHPVYEGNGVFDITNDFPAGGEYKVIADFKPTDGDAMTKMEWVRVEGTPAAPVPLVPDTSLEKTIEGNQVTLTSSALEAQKEVIVTFSFLDEKTKKPISDLEPYLGAIGHVVILSEDGQNYVHAHAEEDQGSGPEARFEAEFPKKGIYKIWGQFQRNQHVFTTSYVVNVQ
ncbi:hypothetical protein EDM56_30505 [Brevibacillus fluminis]|uniref:YtkA-like domain-containing protein n=1 Tax=Brevibacillus fluminis TaxID=511487 RepID=A0A3M8CRX7_9BACL|nr:hypothetical protein [Brevibacillus fluminis]RNB78530.1 hypothetical protein EDM56_30505 [Brevibacillus fluminis]